MMYRLFFVLMLLAGFLTLEASQKEANIWYFGENAGLDFSSGVPAAVSGSMMNTEEGCAVISDGSGSLLFYTNGITIWNRNHEIMQNGDGLTGHSSSTQSGVIVPVPANPGLFYVFSVSDRRDNNGFRYSVVDITKNNGLGAVTDKNVLLFGNCLEKITAIRDKSCSGIWVIGHEWENNIFRAYRIGESGIDTQPVISATGSSYNAKNGENTNKIGYLKASPDGKRIVSAIYYDGVFEIFDFDNRTGIISNPVTLHKSSYENAYGVEFSPDGTKLYANTFSTTSYLLFSTMTIRLFQFDLSSGNRQDILNSEVLLHQEEYDYIGSQTLEKVLGAIQAGPDGKLYIARNLVQYLAVVNKPNEKGAACSFVLNGVSLSGKNSRRGLPSFIQSYFYDVASFRLPDTTGYAGDKSFKIPVMASLSCDAVDALTISYRLTLRYNAGLYYIDSIGSGSITAFYIDNGEQVVTIADNDVPIGRESGAINFLSGRVLLADTNYTPVRFESVIVSNASVDVDTVHGSLLVLGNCSMEQRKIGVSAPLSMAILPNPANGDISLKLGNAVPGSYRIEVFNMQGQLIFSKPEKSAFYLPELLIPLNVEKLPAGVYYIKLTSPLGTVTKPAVIME